MKKGRAGCHSAHFHLSERPGSPVSNTMGIYLNIRCDLGLSNDCDGEDSSGGDTFADARWYARQSGWEIRRNNISICPACVWERDHGD
jgi:hypothetical protein